MGDKKEESKELRKYKESLGRLQEEKRRLDEITGSSALTMSIASERPWDQMFNNLRQREGEANYRFEKLTESDRAILEQEEQKGMEQTEKKAGELIRSTFFTNKPK